MQTVTRVLRALKRMLLASNVRPRTVLSGAFRGIRLLIDTSRQTQLWLGLHEKEVQPALARLTRGIASAVDIGAAEGEYTMYLLLRTRAQVVAVEPIAELRALIDENLALNGLAESPRLHIVGDYLGTASWARPHTLDSIVSALPRPVFIKLDVDGSELDILESGKEIVADAQVRWLIETHSAELEAQCIEIFRGANRRARIVRNARWRALLPEQRPIEHNRWLLVE